MGKKTNRKKIVIASVIIAIICISTVNLVSASKGKNSSPWERIWKVFVTGGEVSISGGEVSLDPGYEMSLTPGTEVAVTGEVGIAPGSEVEVSGEVSLTPGTTVTLEPGAEVTVRLATLSANVYDRLSLAPDEFQWTTLDVEGYKTLYVTKTTGHYRLQVRFAWTDSYGTRVEYVLETKDSGTYMIDVIGPNVQIGLKNDDPYDLSTDACSIFVYALST